METKRTILRRFEETDAEGIARILNAPEVSRFLAVVPYPYSIEDARGWIRHCAEETRTGNSENWAIELKTGGGAVGSISLMSFSEDGRCAEIGSWLAKHLWNKGLMTEVARAVLRFAAEERKLERLVWKAFEGNDASIAIARKLGFEQTGETRRASRATGKEMRELLYEKVLSRLPGQAEAVR